MPVRKKKTYRMTPKRRAAIKRTLILGHREGVRKADAYAEFLRPLLDDLARQGITSLRQLVKELDRRAIPTPRGGRGRWTNTSVARLKGRLGLGSRN